MVLNVCFISPKGYAAIAPQADVKHIGGAEVQVGIIARQLSRRGHHVSYITHDYGQDSSEAADGIVALKMCSASAGIRGLRFFWPRWSSLRAAMTAANATLYVQAGAEALTGQAAHFCVQHRRAFVFAAASNADCDQQLINLHSYRERLLYKYGLKRASAVIAQTCDQQEMLHRHYGLSTTLIRYCCADSPYQPRSLSQANGDKPLRLLWVGRFSPEKRLELLLDLATMLPKLTFDVVGSANVSTDYSRQLTARAQAIPNVVLHGQVPHAQMEKFYRDTTIVLCTSLWEGFPNVFLEAWSLGIPTVSTVDPDGVIETHRLGGSGQNAHQLSQRIQTLLAEPQTWQECSGNARKYFLEHHTADIAADAYEQLLESVLVSR